jgi:hypothetical protein
MTKRKKLRFPGIATLVDLDEEGNVAFIEIGELKPKLGPDDFELNPGCRPNSEGVQTLIIGVKAPGMNLEMDLEIDVAINSRREVIVLGIRSLAG